MGFLSVCLLQSPFVLQMSMPADTNKHTTNQDRLTVSPVLKGVLALEELARGVVPFTGSAGIQRGLGDQDLVTADGLHKNTHAMNVDRRRIKRNACIVTIQGEIIISVVTSGFL